MHAQSEYELSFWQGKKVLVAGGAGFIGSHLVERLVRSGSVVTVLVRATATTQRNLKDCLDKVQLTIGDIRRPEDCRRAVQRQDVVFNVAGEVGGIGYNVCNHSSAFLNNVLMNLALLEAARLENVERYECTSSTCVYSREKSVIAREDQGFVDDPEPTVLGYGWAKRVAELQARFYAKEYGMKIAIVRPTNAYGPRDNFDPETSHVIPALIRRVFESTSRIRVWGSGTQTRSFIFVKDIARGIMDVTERYAVADPINLGTEEEIQVSDLVKLIIQLSGKKLDLDFDLTKPEGQPRKFADISKAIDRINWYPETTLQEGLRETISWYKAAIRS
jgi:GDP-L-fucose synthase